MLFNSIEFAIFLPLFFVLYWFVFQNKLKVQNIFIVIVSYFFYGWWDWRFLSLIAFSTLVDYVVGLRLKKSNNQLHRRILLFCSVVINIGFLGFFKYYNFFLDSFVDAFSLFGKHLSADRLNIILPVGISFYTFQTLSYSIDVYRKRLEPTRDIISFAAFVSFFPQLVAGPIERAAHLLPQFYKKREFNYKEGVDGIKLVLWGMFKKVVVADTCAKYVDQVFSNIEVYSWESLSIGAVLFSFQIYGDFSGYSDIARGIAKLFGFDLMVNFRYPYFSRTIAEFWRRWHISLSTWFRDYVYIPLGGSKGGIRHKIQNTFIIFIISGFWHGANWTFLMWGALNAIVFVPLLVLGKNRNFVDDFGSEAHKGASLLRMLINFFIVTVLWVFFRADNISDAVFFLHKVFTFSIGESPYLNNSVLLVLLILLPIEWIGKTYENPLYVIKGKYLQYVTYFLLTILVFAFFDNNNNTFIYFQF